MNVLDKIISVEFIRHHRFNSLSTRETESVTDGKLLSRSRLFTFSASGELPIARLQLYTLQQSRACDTGLPASKAALPPRLAGVSLRSATRRQTGRRRRCDGLPVVRSKRNVIALHGNNASRTNRPARVVYVRKKTGDVAYRTHTGCCAGRG